MELKIITKNNTEAGKQKLPPQFKEEIRPDIIKRAVEAVQSHKRQKYGADPKAGKKSAAKLSRRRRDYKGAYGKGLSRMPRKTMSRSGMKMNWVAAFAPGTVGGRRAFPPTANKEFWQKINDKERRKAIRSAMAATMDRKTVIKRGHKAPENYPFVLENSIESIAKTKELIELLEKIGLKQELERTAKYKKRKGALLVVSEKCNVQKSARGVGIDAVEIKNVNAELLAPGAQPGRLTLFTQAAIQKMEKEHLFA